MSDTIYDLLKERNEGAFVVNTDTSQGNGIHWISMIPIRKVLYIIDSLGKNNYRPNDTIMFKQIRNCGYDIKFYPHDFQYVDNSMCGWFSIYVCNLLNDNIDRINDKNIWGLISDKFGDDADDNDIKVLINSFGLEHDGGKYNKLDRILD